MTSLVAVVGPTAVGKSALALDLAEQIDGEIVNADALQVYRRLEIGTAKPTGDDRQRIRHHLVDILDPEQPFSAGRFARLARRAIHDIRARGHSPVVVGGSGFYLRALFEGLSPIPPVDEEVRSELAARIESEGVDALYGELSRRDPELAGRIASSDRQRILRGLEVVLSSGRKLSQWQQITPAETPPRPALQIGLTLPRTILYDRIADRVNAMVRSGWLREIRAMLDDGVDSRSPAFQAIGYRQMVRHLTGDWSRETAIADTIRSTRRYARRQLTWFRREPDIVWHDMSDPSTALAAVLQGLGD